MMILLLTMEIQMTLVLLLHQTVALLLHMILPSHLQTLLQESQTDHDLVRQCRLIILQNQGLLVEKEFLLKFR